MEDLVTIDDVLNWVGSDNYHPKEFATIIRDLVNQTYSPKQARQEIIMMRED